MSDRLSALDVSFLYLESPTTAMHVGEVAIFRAPDSADPADQYDALRRLVTDRISLVPRYRQKVRFVPGRLANPVWVDDEAFDISYHVRRSALPRPGTVEQLRELVGRVQSRHLDRSRPLWEIYLVEGLEDGRSAILTKTHHAMVDGGDVPDIGSLILEPTAQPQPTHADGWVAAREPSSVDLVAGALADTLRRPSQVMETVRAGVADARASLPGAGHRNAPGRLRRDRPLGAHAGGELPVPPLLRELPVVRPGGLRPPVHADRPWSDGTPEE